jgi:hypothetical protein
MPPATFPTALFGFLEQEVDIEGQTLDGGTALSGASDKVATDGGGRVFAEFAGGNLVDRNKVLAWRALLANLENGVETMVVPFCDLRHQPYGNEHTVPYGDGAVHSDGTPFAGGGPFAESTADAALRATTIEFNAVLARPLLGGEWFSVEHPTKGWRAYKVRTVDAEAGTMTYRPPLREAVPAGTQLDFANPRCAMVQDGRASARLGGRRHTVAAIRFVEAR